MYYLMPFGGLGDDGQIVENAAIPSDLDPEEFIPEDVIVPSAEEGSYSREDISIQDWMFPASLATQIFSIVPGIAGGLAGFVLASKLSNAKSVKASEVLLASGTVALITFLSVFLVRTIDEFD